MISLYFIRAALLSDGGARLRLAIAEASQPRQTIAEPLIR